MTRHLIVITTITYNTNSDNKTKSNTLQDIYYLKYKHQVLYDESKNNHYERFGRSLWKSNNLCWINLTSIWAVCLA